MGNGYWTDSRNACNCGSGRDSLKKGKNYKRGSVTGNPITMYFVYCGSCGLEGPRHAHRAAYLLLWDEMISRPPKLSVEALLKQALDSFKK